MSGFILNNVYFFLEDGGVGVGRKIMKSKFVFKTQAVIFNVGVFPSL